MKKQNCLFFFTLLLVLILILVLKLSLSKFGILGKKPGQSCTPTGTSDPNGTYEYDYNLNCTLAFCKPTYIYGASNSGNNTCVKNTDPKIGDLCLGTDKNSICTFSEISTTSPNSPPNSPTPTNKCNVVACNKGYTKSRVSGKNICTFNPNTVCPYGTDPNGYYTYDTNSNCVLTQCDSNYNLNADRTACVPSVTFTEATDIQNIITADGRYIRVNPQIILKV